MASLALLGMYLEDTWGNGVEGVRVKVRKGVEVMLGLKERNRMNVNDHNRIYKYENV